ncbi:MAG: RecX family transcriptional regulator [Methylobacterium frigidaeris]
MRPITQAGLERSALHYLERYAASAEMLRRVLLRRVETRCRAGAGEPEAFRGMVEAVVERACRAGLVDDAAFAQAKVRSLRRRGGSARAIAAKLAAKGVDRGTVGEALAAEAGAEAGEDDEENAARTFARRKRLGPWRRAAATPEGRARELASMARAGFGFDLARRVIDGPGDEEAG